MDGKGLWSFFWCADKLGLGDLDGDNSRDVAFGVTSLNFNFPRAGVGAMVAKLAPPAPRRKSRSLLLSASRNSADEESAGIWKETDVSGRSCKRLMLGLTVGGMVRADL